MDGGKKRAEGQTLLLPSPNSSNPSSRSAAPECLGSRRSPSAAEEEGAFRAGYPGSCSAAKVFLRPGEFWQRQQFESHLAATLQQALAADSQPLPLSPADKSPLPREWNWKYMEETQWVDERIWFGDSRAPPNHSFEDEASFVLQELGVISTAIEKVMQSVQPLCAQMNRTLLNTERAVNSYMMLRARLLRFHVETTNSGTSTQPTGAAQPVGWFEKYLIDFFQRLEELEQLVHLDIEKMSSRSGMEMLLPLPKTISSGHDFLSYLATKAGNLLQYTDSIGPALLTHLQHQRDTSDPNLRCHQGSSPPQPGGNHPQEI